jgi:hypothetical protein
MRDFFKSRSVVEIMVLSFTFIVAGSIVFTAATVMVVELLDPTTDTTRIVESLTSIITSILAALLGLLAGQSSALSELGTRPDGSTGGITADPPPEEGEDT